MIEIKTFTEKLKPTSEEKKQVVDFLYHHLESFGDPKNDIEKAVNYSLKEYPSFGGFVLAACENKEVVGAVVVNQTGMKDYIPENILVYIATHNERRGKGIGKQLMQEAINQAEGNIALHVEPDNPARYLYEKLGFTSKYLEMRLMKSSS
ncbi:GNAT family N-acetyltransferase [Sunxiuqinia dokdonensis]|uniref:GNAT family acetyltransferase n=1 Tax=Sunxiuqinia dokdonensis TaxID=1409788 RepID=A0A0L8VFJ0_9BACT|nr:GNAT family N-acetyltransferase [Sunxiuqinia dokdonensis]KOH46952.1 GNAT family acetyltransferase [Sunxiuqinia dokdonensis]